MRATLLADNNGLVWKIGDEIVTGFNPGAMHFPELPANLYDRPTLLWTLENHGPERQKVEASYLATRLAWSADYVLTVNRDETTADLDGWVTLTNNSGTAFQNAKLQLVAGELNRVVPAQRALKDFDAISARAAAAAPAFQQEAFSEYHLYTLGRRTSVLNNESKQISLLDATSSIPLTQNLRGGRAALLLPQRDAARRSGERSRAGLLQIQKRGERPTWACRCRRARFASIKPTQRGNTLFAGEDRIDHTPKDEEVKPAHRQCLRRGRRAQADRLQSDHVPTSRNGVRNHAAESQGRRPSPSRSTNPSAATGRCSIPPSSTPRPQPSPRSSKCP